MKLPASRVLLLLFAEVLLIATSGMWDRIEGDAKWPMLIYSAFFCAGGYVLVGNRRWVVAYVLLTAGAFLGAFLSSRDLPLYGALNLCCLLAVNLLLFHAVVRYSVLNQTVPQTDRVLAGIAGYLLLGVFWSGQFGWFELFGANGLIVQGTGEAVGPSGRLYFSFVTLTTLGYGDIVPASPGARVLVIFTTLSGVLYLAVFISALVGGLKRS